MTKSVCFEIRKTLVDNSYRLHHLYNCRHVRIQHIDEILYVEIMFLPFNVFGQLNKLRTDIYRDYYRE